MDTFLDGLVAYDVPSSLDGDIDLAIRVDLQVQDRRRERFQMRHLVVPEEFPTDPSPRPAASAGEEEPMQLGRNSLTGVEQREWRQSNLCLYCGGQGNFVVTCPVRAPTHTGYW